MMAVLLKKGRTWIGWTLPLALVLVVVAAGCGKKGPPRPPQRPAPPAVQDLAVRLEADWAVLTWTVPTAEAVQAKVTAFYVYAAKTAVGDKSCEGCPPAFRQVGEVVYHSGTQPVLPMAFKSPVEPEFIYLFKVSARDKSGIMADSNIVRVETE